MIKRFKNAFQKWNKFRQTRRKLKNQKLNRIEEDYLVLRNQYSDLKEDHDHTIERLNDLQDHLNDHSSTINYHSTQARGFSTELSNNRTRLNSFQYALDGIRARIAILEAKNVFREYDNNELELDPESASRIHNQAVQIYSAPMTREHINSLRHVWGDAHPAVRVDNERIDRERRTPVSPPEEDPPGEFREDPPEDLARDVVPRTALIRAQAETAAQISIRSDLEREKYALEEFIEELKEKNERIEEDLKQAKSKYEVKSKRLNKK